MDNWNEEELRVFNNIYEDIIKSDLALDSVAQKIADTAAKHLNTVAIVLTLLDESKKNIYAHTISSSLVGNLLIKAMGGLSSFRVMQPIDNNYTKTIESIKENKIMFSRDVADMTSPPAPRSVATLAQALYRIQSNASIPIYLNGQPVGAMIFAFHKDLKEVERDKRNISVMSKFAELIGFAISRSKMYEFEKESLKLLKERYDNLRSIYNLTTQISKSLDPEEVAQTAVNSLPQDELMIGAVLSAYDKSKGEVYVHSLTQNALSYQVQKIIGDFQKYKLLIDDPKYQDNLILKAVKYENIQSSESLADMLVPVFNKQIVKLIEKILQIKSVVVYPVKARGEVIGTITYLLKSKNYTDLNDNEKQLFETFTNQISIALENANLFTQQKLTQRELQKTLKELNERRRFEQDMIDVMGHELRTPMSIVRNALSLMDMELKSKGQIALEHQKKYVTMGLEAARREVNLIETLLSATKSEGKGFQLILEKVNLVEIVNNSILGHSAEASKKNLKITFHESTKELFVYADKTRTQEISDNFMSNAIKYTDKGGVEIKLYTENKMAYVSYIDSGIGISEEDISKLGQKFFRAQQYTDEEQNELNIVRPGGTGLGLYVSFGLIKVMDGDLRIQSKVDVGSTFTFGLPLYTNQERKQLSRNATNYKTDTEN